MNTIHELNDTINDTASVLTQEFPELSKYITEMPLKSGNYIGDVINVTNLRDYQESLFTIMNKYAKSHPLK